jgi:hypothetical protein
VTERAHQDNALSAQSPSAQFPLPSPPGSAPRPKSPANSDSPPPSPPPSRWAALLAGIHEVLPLIGSTCPSPLTFIAVLTDPWAISRILAHLGEPTADGRIPPGITAPRGPSSS